MSYALIRDAIKSRIDAISEIGHVYDRYKWSLAPTQSSVYKAQFVDASNFINFAIVSRANVEDIQPDEDNVRIRRHNMRIMYFYSLDEENNSEHTFHDNVDLILADFENGDRTFDSNAYCSSLGDVSLDEVGGIGKRADPVHIATITLIVDELV